jgi:BirA family transcriptional regulator, biotin operon repressor / biotin---[acetyl-CoA-carboxylase] ligase
MRDKILELLRRKDEYISGEEISQHLGITRQALWKHIQELRDAGYDIVAIPHLGYRILSSPDRLYPAEITEGLGTKFIGRKVYYYDHLPSTMDAAMELCAQGAAEGTVVVAEYQTKGRGRLGRSWVSTKYKGIYLTFILKPDMPASQIPVLTLMTAVSICEGIKECAGVSAQIKWPNDILVNGRKLGGILTELKGEIDAANFVIIGFGLNVNNSREELVPGAVSLKEEKKEDINRLELLKEILRRIEENYGIFAKKGSAVILDKWRGYNVTLGRRIKLACRKEHLEGLALDIDSDGGILVRRDSGIVEKFMAGDIAHLR